MTQAKVQGLTLGYEQVFGDSPARFVFAPGRFNLIGEHVDYLGGKVFPGAITQGIAVAAGPRDDGQIHLYWASFPEQFKSTALDGVTGYQESLGWANYPLGMIYTLRRAGIPLIYPAGCNLYFTSDLPRGAGLSSSAAIELATAFAVSEAGDDHETRSRYAQLAQKAENEFVGVQCGIMDQFAIAQGKPGKLVLLDTATLEFSLEPWPLTGSNYHLYILNSNKERKLAESAFNDRRTECENALSTVNAARTKSGRPVIANLAAADAEDLTALSGNELKRARHVVTEVARVTDIAGLLGNTNLSPEELSLAIGGKLTECHQSLRDDFAVSCPELDTLVDLAGGDILCLGARMVGAGFGGCVLGLFNASDEAALAGALKKLASDYEKTTGLPLTVHPIFIGPGVHVIQ